MKIFSDELGMSKKRQVIILSLGIPILVFYCCWFLWHMGGFILRDCCACLKRIVT